ncbi:MAG TPA: hypothetical protein VGM25_12165 [Caulobacteraceae bacterium]|jgi:hypothetical protein
MFAPIFACLFGCGEQVSVTVQATAEPKARAEIHFVLAASDPNVRPTNPDFIALSKAVSRALTSQGFEAAKTPEAGDLVVVIDWMVGEPKVVARHAGGDSGAPQVRGAAPGGKGGMPLGGSNNYGSFGFGAEATDRGELVYKRTVTLKGVDRAAYKADPKAQPAWSMTLTSDGDTDEVPKFAPPVMAAAMPYLATNAADVRVRLGSTEDPVKYVRGDIPALPVKK